MHLQFLKEKKSPTMFCFHINCSFKLGPCFEPPCRKNMPWLHRKQEGTSLMMFGHLNLAVWMLSVTSNLLLNVNFMRLYKFRPCSMWIWEAQVSFAYASIPKNTKLFGMPCISNVLEKTGLLIVRILGPWRIILRKKDLDSIPVETGMGRSMWLGYPNNNFYSTSKTNPLDMSQSDLEATQLCWGMAAYKPGLCSSQFPQHSAVLMWWCISRVRAGLHPSSSGHTLKSSRQSGPTTLDPEEKAIGVFGKKRKPGQLKPAAFTTGKLQI